jgi:hypothetical protein
MRRLAWGEVGVRVRALQNLGKTGLPEVVDILRSFKFSGAAKNYPEDRDHPRFWPAVQIGLREVMLGGIVDPEARSAFLENVLTEPHDAMSKGAVLLWVITALCDSGSSPALPRIRQTLSDLWPGQPFAEEEAAFRQAGRRARSGSSQGNRLSL